MTTILFINGLLTFYMRGRITTDGDFIYLADPGSFLGFIPLGRTHKQLMVTQVASTSIGFSLILRDLIASIIESVIGVLLWQCPLICLSVIALSAATFIGAFRTTLTVNLTSGEHIVINFLFFEKQKAYNAVNMINNAINDKDRRL